MRESLNLYMASIQQVPESLNSFRLMETCSSLLKFLVLLYNMEDSRTVEDGF